MEIAESFESGRDLLYILKVRDFNVYLHKKNFYSSYIETPKQLE